MANRQLRGYVGSVGRRCSGSGKPKPVRLCLMFLKAHQQDVLSGVVHTLIESFLDLWVMQHWPIGDEDKDPEKIVQISEELMIDLAKDVESAFIFGLDVMKTKEAQLEDQLEYLRNLVVQLQIELNLLRRNNEDLLKKIKTLES